MYKKILVPLDGSERAESILTHVKGLASCLESEVILLRVFKTDFSLVDYYGHDPKFYEAIRANCKDEILAYLTEIQAEQLGTGLKVRRLAEEGPVIDTILSVADRESADLIAMSSHGRTGLSRVIYGSVAAGVLCKVDRPLLLIRREES
ncbi:MAG: universal stress protein [Anaerolineales bacterium]|jgi:nucleotide-binding universal stress UspA family protein